jgi:hypothetical protein
MITLFGVQSLFILDATFCLASHITSKFNHRTTGQIFMEFNTRELQKNAEPFQFSFKMELS